MVTIKTPPGAPPEVADRAARGLDGQRHPSVSPTLDLPVAVETHGTPRHRVVAIGDSLSHGFQSGAVFNTDLSFPALIARELGWADYSYPTYGKAPGEEPGQDLGGLPLNVEYVLRRLGSNFKPWMIWKAITHVQRYMDEVEDYWEQRPAGRAHPDVHDLAVYGWTLRDALTTTYASCAAIVSPYRQDNMVNQFVESGTQRAAMRVYPNQSEESRTQTVFAAAQTLGDDAESEAECGIETLIVMLGSNNALSAITDLRLEWTDAAYGTAQEFARVTQKITPEHGRRQRRTAYTVWRPDHFTAELAEVVQQVKQIKARHVIWCTVPHVTIAPIANGIPSKENKTSPYFDYYVRPWIDEKTFRSDRDDYLTGDEARLIDSAIDFYNDAIEQAVRDARTGADGVQRDWLIFDFYALLEGLATRRYDTSGTRTSDTAKVDRPGLKRPDWLPIHPLPPELAALEDKAQGTSLPDTRFLSANGEGGRGVGGLFGLDGVHPTTVAYGIIAQELITIMSDAGVVFRDAAGDPRPAPVTLDFTELITQDTLVRSPPQNIAAVMTCARLIDHGMARMQRLLRLRERVGPITDMVSPGSQRSA